MKRAWIAKAEGDYRAAVLLLAQEQSLLELTVYAVDIRYPGADMARDDAEAAIHIAAMVRDLVRTALGLPETLH